MLWFNFNTIFNNQLSQKAENITLKKSCDIKKKAVYLISYLFVNVFYR